MNKITRLCITALILAFFGWMISRNMHGLHLDMIHWNGWAIAGAFFFVQLNFLTNVFAIQKTMDFLDAPIPFKTAYGMFFIANLGRYIPGRVWQFLAMGYLAQRRGVPFKESSSLFVFNQILVITLGLLFVIVNIGIFSAHRALLVRYSLAPLLPILVVLFWPNLLIRMMNILLRLLRRAPVQSRITYSYMLKVCVWYVLSNIFTGIGFICLVRGLGLGIGDPAYLMAVYPLAYLIGYLTLLTPGGLGIRESTIVFLLKASYSAEYASLVALMALIWVVSVEMTNSVLALLITPGLKEARRPEPAEPLICEP